RRCSTGPVSRTCKAAERTPRSTPFWQLRMLVRRRRLWRPFKREHGKRRVIAVSTKEHRFRLAPGKLQPGPLIGRQIQPLEVLNTKSDPQPLAGVLTVFVFLVHVLPKLLRPRAAD